MPKEDLENNIVDALLEAGSWRKDDIQRTVVIRRNEKELFKFRIEPIDEDTWMKCRRQNLRNKGRRNEELDDARFLAQVIYEATAPEDKHLWKNDAVLKKLNVASGIDVVNYVLKPAEKSQIVEVISKISGYDDDETIDNILRD